MSRTKTSIKHTVSQLLSTADIRTEGDRPWDLRVHHGGFYDRLVASGSLGLGESYVEGWWDCDDLSGFFHRLLQADLHERARSLSPLAYASAAIRAKILNPQHASRVFRSGGAVHYNLGNDFYRSMLDSNLMYSCGYWKEAESLDQAQTDKMDLICKKLSLKPGMRVLEIGCGWGGFLKHAVTRYGVRGLGVTISKEQAALARERCDGIDAEVRLMDYRNLIHSNERYDRIVSIGMFEHVGPRNYRTFMKVARHCLKPDGLFLLHTIGGNRSDAYADPWFDRYIFPDSVIPSIQQIGRSIEGLFRMEDWHNFGPDYDKTLMAWHSNFERSWAEHRDQLGDEFYRKWRYYLQSCAGAFRARHIHLWQLVLSPQGIPGGYQCVR